MTNFTECEARFTADNDAGKLLRSLWGWNGTIVGIVYNNMTQISREGCIQVCGSEPDIYAWRDISGVITTWVLPTIGILLQAPFESNAARRTLLAITRWVGSPIASLSYVLWNIKVSAKAALMVDMAVKYDDKTPEYKELDFFISILWFLFAFALSIQDAFSELGANTTAHDLALGCLLAWFPVLILGSIVDRNPIAAEAIRKKLNTLVDHVRHSLDNEPNRSEYLKLFQGEPNYHDLEVKIGSVAKKAQVMDDFFENFAGQARVRWHYGAAHAILCDIEDCYIQKKGRDWLANEHEARAYLVLGTVNDEGLVWFDFREFWQIFSAVIIVGGSCGGAFILSYFTPTIGLGCRSGGYTIFFTVATGLLIVEMAVWMYFSPEGRRARVEKSLEKTQAKWDLVFFRPIELFNTIWLMYIVMAQVTGLYRTCDCITSNWAGGGGYLDFSQQFTSNSYGIALTWKSGTSLTALVMGLSMFYITVEWCQQSHLSTEDYQDAMQGLRMTREYRLWTMHARRISRATLTQLGKLAFAIGKMINMIGPDEKPRKTLMWTGNSTSDPVLNRADSARVRNDSHSTPTFEMRDYNAGTHNAVLGTTAIPNSSSPPAITIRGTRSEGDASVDPLGAHSGPRISDDSSTPLVPRASQEHQQHDVEDQMSSEEHSNEETPFFVQGRMRTSTQTWPNAPNPVQNRQGYHRANSDPGLLHE
ncbi:hypothetical protein J4E83_008583 [Alternaria metachromatica]|uniref:uncharacterized protein n=1 Tax=Alternaria metachromatica TaxID=283354 RepID=UPI0020C360A0|nr:uncharacterized protein J4E83_008583 [Alternaria metachromatica]KAI4610018.1 hypothetical protein J4E83_008583 [Alternaria metachromatica]